MGDRAVSLAERGRPRAHVLEAVVILHREQRPPVHRDLVRATHPDILMGRGVPAEMIQIATRKLAAINDAYAVIARERRL